MCSACIVRVLTSPQKKAVNPNAATSLVQVLFCILQVQASDEPPPSFSRLCGAEWELG